MILTDKQEQLSLAVLHATCARAGFAYHISHRIQDNWGWDAHADVKERFDQESTLFNFRIRFQLKATRQQMPDLESEWLSCSAEQLVLRRCLRWVSLRNAPAPERADQETITVYLPEKQVLTPDALRKLARTRSLEQWIDYDAEGKQHADHP